MSGYDAPLDNLVPKGGRLGAPPVYSLPFRGQPALRLKNTPNEYITKMSPGTIIPRFFLAAGADDGQDVQAAQSFRQELQLYQAQVPLDLVPELLPRRQRLARGRTPDARQNDAPTGAQRRGGRRRGGSRPEARRGRGPGQDQGKGQGARPQDRGHRPPDDPQVGRSAQPVTLARQLNSSAEPVTRPVS